MRLKCLILVISVVTTFSLSGQNLFSDVSAESGIVHSYGIGGGGGVSFCDFDGDGLDDLTLAGNSGSMISFYRNTGEGFEELTPLVSDTFETKQIIWVDYDNDGDKDLYLSSLNGPNRLFNNDGDLNMTDVTEAAGLPLDVFESYGACWGDIDRDGWLDVYFTKRAVNFPTNRAWMYRNNGDGTFTDISESSMTDDPGKAAFMPVFFDFNGNLWQDIYVAQDKTTINSVFKNNGNLTFTDIGESSGGDVSINAMCVAAGDYDNDGDLDIYVSNTPEGNKLLNNQGDETFVEMADASGVGFYGIGWGSNFLDSDLDGDLDLYASGMSIGSELVSSLFFENVGEGQFEIPDANFAGDTVSSFANAVGDYNNDGLPDIFVVNTAPFNSHLWGNMAQNNDNNYLKVKLSGVLSNKAGIGSWISIFTDGERQVRYTHCGIGFLGQNSETEIFGLGSAETVDSLHVTWLTGHVDRLYDISANQTLSIEEGSTTGGDIYVDPEIGANSIFNPEPRVEKATFKVIPNPSQGELRIQSPDFPFNELTIFNLEGQQVFHQSTLTTVTETAINTNLAQGVYMVRLTGQNGKQQYRKWMVN